MTDNIFLFLTYLTMSKLDMTHERTIMKTVKAITYQRILLHPKNARIYICEMKNFFFLPNLTLSQYKNNLQNCFCKFYNIHRKTHTVSNIFKWPLKDKAEDLSPPFHSIASLKTLIGVRGLECNKKICDNYGYLPYISFPENFSEMSLILIGRCCE